jgi:hypothetical protein
LVAQAQGYVPNALMDVKVVFLKDSHLARNVKFSRIAANIFYKPQEQFVGKVANLDNSKT